MLYDEMIEGLILEFKAYPLTVTNRKSKKKSALNISNQMEENPTNFLAMN